VEFSLAGIRAIREQGEKVKLPAHRAGLPGNVDKL
jgi:hypothetical protein